MSNRISRNGRCPFQIMLVCLFMLFTALRHTDHKPGRVMAIVTER